MIARLGLDPKPECGTEGGGPAAPLPAAKLRVATFNVLHGQTDEGDATLDSRVPLAVAALQATGADVVGLQEASVTTTHGHVTKKLAAGLAAASGVRWHWCWFQSNPHFPLEPDLRAGGGGGPLTEVMVAQARAGQAEFREGLGVLSRTPILANGVRRHPPRSYEAPFCVPPDPLNCNAAAVFDARAVLWARVATAAGAVDVFTTHLAHGLTPLSELTKRLQTVLARVYIDEVARPDPTPDVFVGDFNSPEGSSVGALIAGAGFRDSFRMANPQDRGFTGDQDIFSRTITTTERIDYVYVRRGACGVEITASDRFPDAPDTVGGKPLWPSDHLGVVTTLDLCPIA